MSAEQPHHMILIGRMLSEGTPQIDLRVASKAARAYLSELSASGSMREQEIWLNLFRWRLEIGDQMIPIQKKLRVVEHITFKHNGPLLTQVETQVLCLADEQKQLSAQAQRNGLDAISASIDRMREMDILRPKSPGTVIDGGPVICS